MTILVRLQGGLFSLDRGITVVEGALRVTDDGKTENERALAADEIARIEMFSSELAQGDPMVEEEGQLASDSMTYTIEISEDEDVRT